MCEGTAHSPHAHGSQARRDSTHSLTLLELVDHKGTSATTGEERCHANPRRTQLRTCLTCRSRSVAYARTASRSRVTVRTCSLHVTSAISHSICFAVSLLRSSAIASSLLRRCSSRPCSACFYKREPR